MEKHNDALDRALTDLYCSDIPEGCRASWRAAVKREEQQKMRTKQKRSTFWRVAIPVAAALVLVIGAITAGNLIPTVVEDNLYTTASTREADYAGYSNYDSAEMGAVPAASEKAVAYSAASGSDAGSANTIAADDTGATESGVKIVRTADLVLASTDFDADVQALTDLTKAMGGYVASVSLSGEASERKDRVAYYSLRIPSDKLDAFLNGLEGIGRITSRNETATDMTTQYNDTEMRLNTQQDKMTRLRELLKKADDVSDLLEIESEIADTQYQIDRLQSSLRTIDRNVDNSSVSVTIREQSDRETAEATELTLWQRLESGFQASIQGIGQFFQNMLVFIAILLPVLVPLAVVIVVVWLIVRARRRNPKTTGSDDLPPQE
ncbi:MAG: DUF4349 domain-containing protein [Eubacteriales bacterium]|nr:DUF4349 domain-containing protein [Eubacteriales bacterium]